MICGIFHKGSGLGNQLHRYIATRIKALELGVELGMIAPELFKGKGFMNLDMGYSTGANYTIEEGTGRVVPEFPLLTKEGKEVTMWQEWNKQVYDPDFNFIQDNTIIDGNFEDERYWCDNKISVKKWLKVEPLYIPDDLCVIGFRGGEFYTVPELGLPKEYFDRAIVEMKKINPQMKFEVHTDDPELAKQFFPEYKIIHDIGINWRSIRYARYAIIANSSFYILPRVLRHTDNMKDEFWKAHSEMISFPTDALTLAPRYFNRYNVKRWDYPQSYYKQFKYI